MRRPVLHWVAWGALTLALSGYFSFALLAGEKTVFVPGKTTDGHHQIELACEACHTKPFGGGPVLQDACMNCHAAQLKAADDSHPKSKFTDPRNAALTQKLDARLCVTCHAEHAPARTAAMGVTLPGDFCVHCHADIGKERESHATFEPAGCAAAGCHNFHDNRALYEDFLVKHAGELATKSRARIPGRNLSDFVQAVLGAPRAPLTQDQHNAPAHATPTVLKEWAHSAHARAGVNCADCHQDKAGLWVERPAHSACASCHRDEVAGFLRGKHGMRLDAKLGPMTPAQARLSMKTDAHSIELGCATCHSAHAVDTRRAAVEACQSCHDDPHTRAYRESPHALAWEAELAGRASHGSGVSCATCHLPRALDDKTGRVRVQHNQSDNLRPNEKMLRSVCMNCHGLGFALDALADSDLVARNFRGAPSAHVESLDMAVRRAQQAKFSPTPKPNVR